MFNYLKILIVEVITNKHFWIGFFIAIAAFSHYIFGPENALEQLGELFTRIFTGIDTDFSPHP